MVGEEDEDDEEVEEKPQKKAGKIPKASKKTVAIQKAPVATKKRSAKQEEKADIASDRSKNRNAAKHCMEPGCLKKKITGPNWA
jgi:hypothetical protein